MPLILVPPTSAIRGPSPGLPGCFSGQGSPLSRLRGRLGCLFPPPKSNHEERSMVKPLAFKGEKKSKKRKSTHQDASSAFDGDSKELTVQNTIADGGEDDSWVTAEASTDVTGPVIFALPSANPTCIACDANGKVFASELENIVDGDLATAEPHDVRQVFIANRVAGSDEISFKGHHGRYRIFIMAIECGANQNLGI